MTSGVSRRAWSPVLVDALAVVALVAPSARPLLWWLALGLYALVSLRMVTRVHRSLWIFDIARDPRTRIAHGREHATLAILADAGQPVLRGFTHGRDRYTIAARADEPVPLAAVRAAAASAIHRVRHGERALAYQPGCGTSEVAAAVTPWLVFVVSVAVTLALGAPVEVFVALGAIVLRVWLAAVTALGLLAQRWLTVTPDFIAADVVTVRPMTGWYGHVCPPAETWFEVVVAITPAAAWGGLAPV